MWKRVLTSDGARPARTRGWTPPAAREFGGSVQVRCVDAGSCNGCEIAGAFNPVYDAEHYGARLMASAGRADPQLHRCPSGGIGPFGPEHGAMTRFSGAP
ncbi:hypothetical protein [Streptomyces sp. NPDC059224]|uniref:hypothetical protein n=1 Tax=Streptomyces sp. NPDC059224 TaxID=3346775 RepID=UPI0036978E08